MKGYPPVTETHAAIILSFTQMVLYMSVPTTLTTDLQNFWIQRTNPQYQNVLIIFLFVTGGLFRRRELSKSKLFFLIYTAYSHCIFK